MKKEIKLTYLKKATKFLTKNKILTEDIVDSLVIKAIRKIVYNKNENIDCKYLKGVLSDKIRIRKNKIRIIISIKNNEIIIEAIIEDIDFRGNIYN